MRTRPGERGSVTIYLLIMLLALIFFLGLLVDLGRIRIAQNQLRKAANTASRSLLADYDQALKDQYGLFAMSTGPVEGRKQEFNRYLAANLAGAPAGSFSLLDFRLEDSSIIVIRPLEDTAVLQQQILEEMKYRAPVDLAVEVAGRFRELGGLFGVFGMAEKEKKNIESIDAGMRDIKEGNRKIRQLSDRRSKLREEIKRKESRLNGLKEKLAGGGPPSLEKEISLLKAGIERDRRMSGQLKGDIREEAARVREARDRIEESLTSLEKGRGMTGGPAGDGAAGGDELERAIADADRFIKESLSEYTGRLKQDLENDFPRDALDSIGTAGDEESFDQACGGLEGGGEGGETSLEEESQKMASEEKSRLDLLKSGPHVQLVNSFEGRGDSFSRGAEVIETGEKLLDIINMEEELIGVRDELFINEFVLSERGGKLRFENLAANDFNTERADAEYIICGSWMKALEQVWLVRFTLDAPAYFVLRFKVFGPVWGTAAALAVGAVQASVDTLKLIKNEEIGIIEVFPPGGCRLQDIKVNYRDMLRLVALINSDREGKLTRTAGKIGERTGADLSGSSTAVFGDVTVSVRLWFLPAVGIGEMAAGPFDTVIRGGRCYITKNVEYSY
ncbi:MAG: pilus assembly protein TadG-related protein [Actinobacteria bacterium]|nr:pilus assembly protein TadG-related protein [Actinomycetota bacterium]